MASLFVLAAEGPSWLGFQWTLNGGETLRFKLAVAPVGGEPHVLFMSAVCPESELPSRRVLVEAAALGPGIVLEDGLYIARHGLRLAGLDSGDVERALALVADATLRVRGCIQPRPGSPAGVQRPFANFAD